MLDLGPQVAIVDNEEEEVKSIESSLEELHIGYKFFNADPFVASFPDAPIDTIELVFLDLFYSTDYNKSLDPYSPAQWVDKIIPQGKEYYLIVLSRDIHDANSVIKVLYEINKLPVSYRIQKKEFETKESILDIKSIFEGMKIEYQKKFKSEVTEFIGEIINVDDEEVVVNCLIDAEKQIYQIRRFDKLPLKNIRLENGSYLTIKITTKPGERLFEFINNNGDHNKLFEQKNLFEKYKNSPMLGK